LFFIHPTFLGAAIHVPVLGWDITEFAHAITVAVVLLVVALVCLIAYALAEKPYLDRLAQEADKGWTREDAETSGL
jgi:Tfp pilus assembly protein PilO